MSIDGKFCPEIEFAPRTPEGIHVADVLDRPGIWRRAGLNGVVTGMDVAEARAALPALLQNDFATRLLVIAERQFVTAVLQSASEKE